MAGSPVLDSDSRGAVRSRTPRRRRIRLLLLGTGAVLALVPTVLQAQWATTVAPVANSAGAASAGSAASAQGDASAASAATTSRPSAKPAPTGHGHGHDPKPRPPGAPALSFNPSLILPTSTGLAEPSIRTRSDGTSLVIAPGGVPGPCRLFSVAHDGSHASFLGAPDRSLGGGDCDLAVGPAASGGNGQTVAYSSLLLANITTGTSSDGGTSFGPPNPFSQQVALDDRMWMAADPQLNAQRRDDVFMIYHDIHVLDIEMGVSVDGGQTFVQSTPVINPADVPPGQWASASCPGAECVLTGVGIPAGAGNELGNLVARRDGAGQLTLYSTFLTPDSQSDNVSQGVAGTANLNRVYEAVGTVSDGPVPTVSWRDYPVWRAPVGVNFDHIFPVTAVDGAGRVYTAWSDGVHVYEKSDQDGTKWNDTQPPIAVDVAGKLYPKTENTAIMPWLAAGPRGVDLVWYGASNGMPGAGDQNDAGNHWNVYMAQSVDGGATWPLARVSDHVIHTGSICTSGDACSTVGGDRTLLDFFQVSIDPSDGAADVTWADDHLSPGTPVLDVSRQCTGPSATTGAALVDDCVAPAPPIIGGGTSCPGPQVVDPSGDAPDPLPGSTSQEEGALDITATSFTTTTDASGTRVLRVTMTIADLPGVPPSADVPNAYWTAYWSFAGKVWFAQATATATTSGATPFFFSDGNYDQAGSPQYTNTKGISGTVTPGQDGTIQMDVPLSDFGGAAGSVLSGVSSDTRVLIGVAGTGEYFVNPVDRAPDFGYGASYTVGGSC